MDHVFHQITDLLNQVIGHDPAMRNTVIMAACIALYGIFLLRGKDAVHARRRRPLRCADSVLRG